MKIGHYMTGIWDHGGIATYIRRVSEAQKQLGHEIVYLDLEQNRPPSGEDSSRVIYSPDESTMLQRAADLQLDLLHVHILVRELNTAKMPVVRTVHGHQPYCPSGSRFLKAKGAPCNRPFTFAGCSWGHIVDRCGSVRPRQFVDDFRRTLKEKHTLHGKCITTVSEFMKDQMVAEGYDTELIRVLYLPSPGVKSVEPPPKEGVPHFVFLGRLSPQKGVAWLLRAANQAKQRVHIDIAGDGDTGKSLCNLAEELGIADAVTFHGWISEDRVNALVRNARALVFPSVWHEPGGTVAFEAMANARAVIMSRVGGMPEIVHHERTGLVISPNDDAALAQAMDRLAGDWEFARNLGIEGHHRAQTQYTLALHVSQLMGVYDKSMQMHQARAVTV